MYLTRIFIFFLYKKHKTIYNKKGRIFMEEVIKKEEKRQYDILDITKYILALLVVMIHTEISRQIWSPIARIAVPMFFIISSFLFFSKIKGKEKPEQKKALWHFVKRELILYGVWFIIILPYMFFYKKRTSWFGSGINGLWTFLLELFFNGTFPASWFIMASIIGTIIVFYLSKIKSKYLLIIVGALCYGACFFRSCLWFLVEENLDISLLEKLPDISFSFVAGILWIVIGKMFAEGNKIKSLKVIIIGLIISLGFLFFENWLFLFKFKKGGCVYFITLVPTCVFLFALLLRGENIKIKYAKFFRCASTLTYVGHLVFIGLFEGVLNHIFGETVKYAWLVYFVTVVLFFVFSLVIYNLQKKPKLKFLKYLY